MHIFIAENAMDDATCRRVQAAMDVGVREPSEVILDDMALLEDDSEEAEADEDGEDLSDEMYDMAVRLVTEHRQASISWLQRRLRVGYNRAARMIERMERDGVVSAPLGARGREVLAPSLEE